MFNIHRTVRYYHSLKYLVRNFRPIYSGRTLQLPPNASYKDTSNDGSNSDGYGDKEICLLGPVDTRTPLPGNTGIPPLSMLYNDTVKEIQKSEEEKCDLLSAELPEQRHRDKMVQVSLLAIKDVHSSRPKLECVAHDCPQLLKKDFSDLFPGKDLNYDYLTVITLCQQTDNDMSQWSQMADLERETLGKYYNMAAYLVCSIFRKSGYWADFIHPDTGRPHSGRPCNSTMLETDFRYRHFGFKIEDLGCCKVISHFLWGTHAYVGAIFTNAPLGSTVVNDILKRLSTEDSEIL